MNKINNIPILKIENVDKSYFIFDKEITIFQNLNVSFFNNFTYAITGVSGSGKTTFLNLVSGFDYIDRGKIIFKEKYEINQLDEYALSKLRNENYGYVFQSFYLLPELNIIENIILPALKKGIKKNIAYERALQLMEEVNISHLKKNKITEISGGEAQRIALARALINDPDVILADEPTGNLDVKNRSTIIELLLNIVRKKNKLLIIVTHDLSIAAQCDYKFKIENYKFVEY
ncbi:MAG: ABC transporter ATP-binding protein [Spirochaetes bacterium]|nr:ABC transporter ATP-binding protein [Spirochaetota bacterium]